MCNDSEDMEWGEGGRKKSRGTGCVWHGWRGIILNGAGVGRQKDVQRGETRVAEKH